MKTEGPAMSFFTSCWLLPQKEQYKFFSVTEPFLSAINDALWFYFPYDNERKTALSQNGGAVFKKQGRNGDFSPDLLRLRDVLK
jgi:hypothetical protein